MHLPIISLLWPFALAVVATAWLTGKAWMSRSRPNMRWFLWLSGAAFCWSLLAFAYHVVEAPSVRHALLHLRYLPIAVIPVCWLGFALAYSGDIHRLKAVHMAALLIVPTATVVFLATNASHHLFFLRLESVSLGSRQVSSHVFGPWFWIHAGYSYLLFWGGLLLTIRVLVRTHPRLRWKAALMVAGASLPGLMSMIYLANQQAFGYVDPAPVAFAVSTATFGLGLFRYDLLDLRPVSRVRAFLESDEPVLVVSPAGRVLDLNPAAGAFFRGTLHLGAHLPEDFPVRCKDGSGAMLQEAPDGTRRFQWTANPVQPEHYGQNAMRGWIVRIRDVEDIARREDNLRADLADARERASALAGTLLALQRQLETPLEGVSGLSRLMSEELRAEARGFAMLIHERTETLRWALEDAVATVIADQDRAEAVATVAADEDRSEPSQDSSRNERGPVSRGDRLPADGAPRRMPPPAPARR